MNRRLFWFGYLLAIGVVLWLLWRQRQEMVAETVQRWRATRPEMMDWPWLEQVQARLKESGAGRQDAGAPTGGGAGRQDAGAPTGDEGEADDLQEIVGIGPAFAGRLKEAGIVRFAQLAALSEEEIRQRIGLEPWQGDVPSWIEQAAALVKKA